MSQDQLTKIAQTLKQVATDVKANKDTIGRMAIGVADLQATVRELPKTSDLKKWKDEILTSNDKVAGKIDHVLTEQQAITINYKRVDSRVDSLELFAKQAASKLGIKFEVGRV